MKPTEEEEEEVRLRFNFRRPAPAAPPKPQAPPGAAEASSGPVAPVKLWEGPIGLLDHQKAEAWEDSLSAEDVRRWDAIKAALAEASPEMRWRAAGWIMTRELEHARKAYYIARNIDREAFKSDMVRVNGLAFRETVEALEARLAPVYDFMRPLTGLLSDLDLGIQAVQGRRGLLARVASQWNEQGQAEGRGVPGYDTEESVQRHQRIAREAHARFLERRSEAAKGRAEKTKGGRSRASKKAGHPGQKDFS